MGDFAGLVVDVHGGGVVVGALGAAQTAAGGVDVAAALRRTARGREGGAHDGAVGSAHARGSLVRVTCARRLGDKGGVGHNGGVSL